MSRSPRLATGWAGGPPGGAALGGRPALESIPAGLSQLFRWSEAQRNLPESLHMAGEMFEARARNQSGFASSIVACFLLLLILWGVGFAIAALFLPMITTIQKLSG